mmetsp:Transcript_26958/g.83004  ORF Transcript_26958/g.83004 Transcript_26958/m.83004 type:complete len:221 (+) Transcript_26958:206-868(+)
MSTKASGGMFKIDIFLPRRCSPTAQPPACSSAASARLRTSFWGRRRNASIWRCAEKKSGGKRPVFLTPWSQTTYLSRVWSLCIKTLGPTLVMPRRITSSSVSSVRSTTLPLPTCSPPMHISLRPRILLHLCTAVQSNGGLLYMSFSSAGLHAIVSLSAEWSHSAVGKSTKNARRFTSANAKADIMPRSRFPRPLNAFRMRYRADSSPFLIFSSSLACNFG